MMRTEIVFVRRLLIITGYLFLRLISDAEPADTFRGWETMRVINQTGAPQILRAGDLFGDGHDELIVVNTRLARLDIYRWRSDPLEVQPEFDPERPNELPMAPEFEVLELALEELPQDAILLPAEDGSPRRLLVLVGPPNRLLSYTITSPDPTEWINDGHWDLLPGTVAGSKPLLLYQVSQEQPVEVLISFNEGVQRIALEPRSRSKWVQPREQLSRRDWWTVDLDGDGGKDIIEWVGGISASLRWWRSRSGELVSPLTLSDRSFKAMDVLGISGQADEVLLLGDTQAGILRRYRVGRDAVSPIGDQRMLALPDRSVWTGFQIEGEPVVVTSAQDQPRFEVFALSSDGFRAVGDFPTVRGIKELAVPGGDPSVLLIWTDESPDLYVSRWEDDRLSYPAPFVHSPDVEERKIVGLSSSVGVVWWAQKVGEDLDVFHWPAGEAEPIVTRFPGIGTNATSVKRLGDRLLLLMETYARHPKLAKLLEDGTVKVSEPAQLRRSRLEEFHVLYVGGERRIGRLTEGVWQWLDDDLATIDQIMLPHGLQLSAFVPLEDGNAWALENASRTLHFMTPDEAGILRPVDRFDIPEGSSLVIDPFLGLMLFDRTRVTRLASGRPWVLELAESIDSRVGRPTGVREATIHRVYTGDFTGDDQSEVVCVDDERNQLTVLALKDGSLEPLISWQVFEKRSYPYQHQTPGSVAEPRTLVSLDIDADGIRDLAMLSHDRLIVYLARKNTVSARSDDAAHHDAN